MSKRTIVVIAGVLRLLVAWWSCHHGSSSNQSQANASGGYSGRRGGGAAGGGPVPVVAGKAEQKDVPIYLDGLGTVQAFNTVTVHTCAEVSGSWYPLALAYPLHIGAFSAFA